eukprot:GHVR01038131.1.p1 GENE.GHVR01038131.1~~GHVR01038131.1.p1  ORF type:complete len:193 (+),score=17.42 GHVR01038131.1:393-971(+)
MDKEDEKKEITSEKISDKEILCIVMQYPEEGYVSQIVNNLLQNEKHTDSEKQKFTEDLKKWTTQLLTAAHYLTENSIYPYMNAIHTGNVVIHQQNAMLSFFGRISNEKSNEIASASIYHGFICDSHLDTLSDWPVICKLDFSDFVENSFEYDMVEVSIYPAKLLEKYFNTTPGKVTCTYLPNSPFCKQEVVE